MNKCKSKVSSKILVTLMLFLVGVITLGHSNNTHANNSNDAQAFSTFDQLNSQDIESAILAVTRGQSEAVRMVGNMIINDHIPLLKEMREMANNKGVSYFKHYETKRTTAHKAIMSSLLSKNLEEFDKAYLDYELKFSQDFVKTLKESIIPSIKDESFKAFLKATLTQFEEHLSHINHAVMIVSSQSSSSHKKDHIHNHNHTHHQYNSE